MSGPARRHLVGKYCNKLQADQPSPKALQTQTIIYFPIQAIIILLLFALLSTVRVVIWSVCVCEFPLTLRPVARTVL